MGALGAAARLAGARRVLGFEETFFRAFTGGETFFGADLPALGRLFTLARAGPAALFRFGGRGLDAFLARLGARRLTRPAARKAATNSLDEPKP